MKMSNSNNPSLFLATLQGLKTPHFPIWMMRQAGRYLPEYQELRKQYGFDTLIKRPDLACEVSLQPIKRFGLDATILFSDILVILSCLNSHASFKPETGLRVDPICNLDLTNYPRIAPETCLSMVSETIRLIKQKNPDQALLGFAGMPFTVLCYWLEGKGSLSFKPVKNLLYKHPTKLFYLMDLLCDLTIEYLVMQSQSGVNALQVFDSWANILSWELSEKLSVNYLKKIVAGVRKYTNTPIFYYSRHASQIAPLLQETGIKGISIEWQASLARLRHQVKQDVIIQGNFDPSILSLPFSYIEENIYKTLESVRHLPNIIINLGHGIQPDANLDTVTQFIQTVQQFKR